MSYERTNYTIVISIDGLLKRIRHKYDFERTKMLLYRSDKKHGL